MSLEDQIDSLPMIIENYSEDAADAVLWLYFTPMTESQWSVGYINGLNEIVDELWASGYTLPEACDKLSILLKNEGII